MQMRDHWITLCEWRDIEELLNDLRSHKWILISEERAISSIPVRDAGRARRHDNMITVEIAIDQLTATKYIFAAPV